MSDPRQQGMLAGAVLLVLLIAALWSTLKMFDQHSAAQNSAADLADCKQIVKNIDQLRKQGSLIQSEGDTAEQERNIAALIDQAAIKTNLSGNWQQGIDHKRPSRVGDSPYLRKPAVLFTRGLTLPQLTALLHELTYDSPLTAYDLKLRTPPGEKTGSRWDADVTLTYLIYAPPTNRAGP